MVVTSVSATRALLTSAHSQKHFALLLVRMLSWYAQEKLKNGPAEQATLEKGEWRAHTHAITNTGDRARMELEWLVLDQDNVQQATGRGCAAATCLLLTTPLRASLHAPTR